MKSASRMKQWLLLLLCVVMTAGVMVQAAGAAEPTKKCTNLRNEGVEYFSMITVMGSDISKWRQDLYVYAVHRDNPKLSDGTPNYAGKVVGMDIEVTDDDTRYTCTIFNDDTDTTNPTHMSCNSIPVNAIINGVYFIFRPDMTTPVNTPVTFVVEQVNYSDPIPGKGSGLHSTNATVQLPPYPCGRNFYVRDFEAAKDKSLVLYEDTDCNGQTISNQVLNFYEKYAHKDKYAIVNLMNDDILKKDRIRVSVTPEVEFDYVLTLKFGYNYNANTGTYGNEATVVYKYNPNATPKGSVSVADSTLPELDNSSLPLTLLGGTISEVNKLGSLQSDWAGNVPFPTSVNFEIRFWYENNTGTIGYENSVFHFIRNLNFKFSSTCSATAETGSLYDPCQQQDQPFLAKFNTTQKIADDTTDTDDVRLYYGRNANQYLTKGSDAKDDKTIAKSQTDPVWQSGSDAGKKRLYEFFFLTFKCVDAACDWITSTTAYPQQFVMSDGGGSSRTFSQSGRAQYASSLTRYVLTPYYDTNRPYAIKEVSFVAPEPGTYVIYAFVDYTQRNNTVPDRFWRKLYVTVNETDELLNCYSRANNGYFKAWWNDCLSPSETQLIPFEHIYNTEEAWVINHSNYAVDYPFIAEYSYLPQKLEVASLNCKFEAIDGGGRPGDGYCNHYNIHVPPRTKVTVTGGTMYMSGYPEFDEYRAAYVREDLVSISHLIFSIGVEQCENKKIPDTGLSLRSPMSPLKVNAKVNESVDPATGFVFTGNSLRIPAIGLGMETPIPIVHVYYENGSNNMVWDLSTLGNYVGELEGGSYIPYGGNSVLTGHFWSGGVFKNLEGLNYEDEIIVFANDGFKYTYQVVQKFIAQPEEVYEMFQQIGERSLTLVTCENYNLVTNEYERRYIVRASIKNVEPYVENW